MNMYDSQSELVSDKIRFDIVMNQTSMPLQDGLVITSISIFCINLQYLLPKTF